MALKGKKFALIWWIDDRKKDVIQLSVIPKKSQEIGCVATLKWNDIKTKKTTLLKAKVLAISDNENELLRIIVTAEGVIHDESKKIFSQDVVENQKDLKDKKKIAKKNVQVNKRSLEEEIKKSSQIMRTNVQPTFPSYTLSLSEVSKSKDIIFSTTGYPHNGPAPDASQPTVSRTEVAQSAPSHPTNKPYAYNPGRLSPHFPTIPTTVPHFSPNYSEGSSTCASSVPTTISHSTPNYPENAYHHDPSTAYTQANHTSFNTQITPYPHNPVETHSPNVRTTVTHSAPNYSDGSSTSYTHKNEAPVQTCKSSVTHTAITHSTPNYPENAYHNPSTSYTHANHTTFNTETTPYPYNPFQTQSPKVPTTVAHSAPNYFDNSYNTPSTSYAHANQASNQTTPSHSTLIDVEEISDSSSENTSSLDENEKNTYTDKAYPDHGIGLLSGIAIGSITSRDIWIQEQILQSMKQAYANQNKMEALTKKLTLIPDCHFQPGEHMEELSRNCGFYIHKNKKVFWELLAEQTKSWKVLVRETILEIYGSSIGNYSTTGKRSCRPPIDFKLFNGLLEWVNQKFAPVSKKDMITYISKMAANKRKYANQRKNLKQSFGQPCKKLRKKVSETQEEMTKEKGSEHENPALVESQKKEDDQQHTNKIYAIL